MFEIIEKDEEGAVTMKKVRVLPHRGFRLYLNP